MASVVCKGSSVTITIGSAVATVTGGTLGETVSYIDVTNLDSTKQEQIKDPLTKAGTFSVDFLATGAHVALLNRIDDSTATDCTVDCPESDGTGTLKATFSAFVSSAEVTGFEVGGVVRGSVDLDLASEITWAAS